MQKSDFCISDLLQKILGSIAKPPIRPSLEILQLLQSLNQDSQRIELEPEQNLVLIF